MELEEKLTTIERELTKIFNCLQRNERDESLRAQAIDIRVQVNSFQAIIRGLRDKILEEQDNIFKKTIERYEVLLQRKIDLEKNLIVREIENNNARDAISDYDAQIKVVMAAKEQILEKIREEQNLKRLLLDQQAAINNLVGANRLAEIRGTLKELEIQAKSQQKKDLTISQHLLDARREYILEFARSKRLSNFISLQNELQSYENLLVKFEERISNIKTGHAYIFVNGPELDKKLTLIFDSLTITPGRWMLRATNCNVVSLNIHTRPIILCFSNQTILAEPYLQNLVDVVKVEQPFIWDSRTEFSLWSETGNHVTVNLDRIDL